MGLGVANHIRIKMFGIPLRLTTETIEWEPGSRMGFRSIKPGRPAIAVATHLFEPDPQGTVYTWSMEFRGRSRSLRRHAGSAQVSTLKIGVP